MRGKFSRGNPQESQFQISSHSETEPIRRASSSNRDNIGQKTCKVLNVVLCYLSVVAAYVCLPCNYSFYGFLFHRVFVLVVRKLRPGLRYSFS